jgi:hypothetical protein
VLGGAGAGDCAVLDGGRHRQGRQGVRDQRGPASLREQRVRVSHLISAATPSRMLSSCAVLPSDFVGNLGLIKYGCK